MADLQNSQKKVRSRWAYLINGTFLTILGIIMWKMPKESMNTILLIVGIAVTVMGLAESFLAIRYRKVVFEWGWGLAGALVDLVIGVFMIANPEAILLIITFFISFWLVLRGISIIRDALSLQKEGSVRWKWVLLFGVALLLLAFILVLHPQILGITLLFWLSISFIILGILRILLAFKLLLS